MILFCVYYLYMYICSTKLKQNDNNNVMKQYTKTQLINAAVKMGCNETEAKKRINKTYNYYVTYRSEYNLKKAAQYCMYIAPCN